MADQDMTDQEDTKPDLTFKEDLLITLERCLAAVTRLHPGMNREELASSASSLHKWGYTVEQIEAAYNYPTGEWYKTDWRGIKKQTPTLKEIEKTIENLCQPRENNLAGYTPA
jgi:uncharacterized protein YpbB